MPQFSASDAKWMALAIQLARKGRFSTTPNPMVGCVIVSADGVLLGKGYHQKAGQGHAEVNALIDAGFTPHQGAASSAQQSSEPPPTDGSTVYVTLEPCSHTGRTPPCANALIEAKVGRVVIASIDTNPLVKNRGVAMLREAGIIVETGLMDTLATDMNVAFNYRMQHHLPWVCVKLACSLDGRTALENGKSKWITSSESRLDVQQERASACAILSGADTIIADDPQLNVREAELQETTKTRFSKRQKQPLRVIIDGKNRLNSRYNLFNDGQEVLVFNTEHNPQLKEANCQQIQLNKKGDFVDLKEVMNNLAALQINRIWTEAGSSLCGALFEQGLVNEFVLYQAPMLLGNKAKGTINIHSLTELDDAIALESLEITQLGNDLKRRFRVKS
ncbi:bifunctional diaminohydroxyphosphoribosylaminopyrimidine deaminase/5-amino-6-(5-phosphoribosylamino)uracil reductase RibD [Alteromonas sp. W364]|uniref:bifunctional diaminohydroxyphosphoribosylaminopyrimidine deaminase/5-amino-6-(5-phosphoribosylamino)uracil reductase RibD n=1 Tax=Alteromonas sp. W364 TaxID=3075610 RepID=UPI002887816E|nr:bifunctional diaminohydroxyphosphoribosylaminopyrimidine deaminase/5-amino-6-(5-phosphoribosylamino)uracil reductase RibD [Alteromonas sp. W364]MDT0628831.1 bifunctional diaminohydroxyphosphoribosylaminopyrimidine deaminase/5-amino-6-(5-phosphoribosylamino)uracil reductase RibD [Alteromonas sp. W364]